MSLLNEDPPASSAFKAEKVSWYKEVLELEPGSKVFLPYSRLLADIGESAEAVRVLRAGLENHPEFTEARLFLINLLHQSGDNAACGAEVARLAGLFSEYPDFWDAWSNFSVEQGERGDLSVSLGMLGALFRNRNVSLLDVLSAGLRGIGESGGSGVAPVFSAPSPAEAVAAQPSSDPEAAFDSSPEAFGGADSIPAFVFSEDSALNATDESSEALEEKSSLRTRSMAEVLAEQGDIRGSIDIYEELLAEADPEDAAELAGRLDSLRSRLGEDNPSPVRAVSASSSASVPASPAVTPGKAQGGVMDLLEKLALRLENKSHQ